MEVQKTSDPLNITVPQKREDVLLFFKEFWEKIESVAVEQCLEISRNIKDNFPGDVELQGCSLLLTASSNFIRNNYKDAILSGFEGLELFRSIQNKGGEGASNIIIGACYRSLGDNDDALNYIQKGITLMPENSIYNRFMIIGYYQGAEIFFLFNKLQESLDYYTKGLNNVGIDMWLKARNLNGIGNVYLKQKKFTEASTLLHDAYNLVKEKENKILIARLLSDLSKYYIEVKDFHKALEYETRSFEIRKNANLKAFQVSNYLNFYRIYNEIGEKGKAITSLEDAFSIARDLDLKGRLADIYEKKVEYFENRQEFEQALKELKKYVLSRENEINASFDLRIKGINAVHEVEFTRKEAEITKEKNKALSEANEKINTKNKELKLTLDELTRTKISRKSVMVTLFIGIALCLLTEAFVDPLVDNLSYNNYISLAIKVIIAISLKPIDSLYESYMIKKALK